MPFWNGGGLGPFVGPCGALVVNPSAAELQAAIDLVTSTATDTNPGIVYVCGDVELEAKIQIAPANSNLIVEFGKNSRITTTLAPAVGQADDPQNHLFGAQGVLVPATLDTSLTANANIGDTTITVASVGTIAVGQYVLLSADTLTAGSDLNGSGAGSVLIFEIRKVTNIAGLVLTLDAPLLEYFAGTATAARVRRVDPARNIKFIGGLLDASGGSIAAGIMSQYALGVQLIGQQAVGFSRAALDLEPATQNFLVQDYVRLGETNADVLMNAAHEGRIIDFSFVPGGARQHANGIPRASITFRGRCASDQVLGGRIGGGNIGVQVYGGLNIKLADVTITDCNPAARIARCGPGNLDGYLAGGSIGAGIDTGALNVATIADFWFGLQMRGVKIENVNTSAGAFVFSAYIHDGQTGDVELEVVNLGVGTSMRGICVSDVNGEFPFIAVRGTTTAITWQNGNYTNRFGDVAIREQGGSGAVYTGAPLFLDISQACEIAFNRLTVSGAGGGNFIGFGAAYPATNIFRAKQLTFDFCAQTLDEMYVAKNAIGSNLPIGSVVQLDATTANQVVACGLGGAPSRFLTIVKGTSDDTSTMGFVCVAVTKPGVASQVRVASAEVVAPGDPLRHGSGGEAVVDAAATNDSLGVAIAIKAAGAPLLMATR